MQVLFQANTMKTTLCTAILLFSAPIGLAAAEPIPTTMTKIVVRCVLPSVPEGSFGRLPQTHYRSGSHFARTEEALDKSMNLQGLIISNMRDSWMINLADKTGKHVVDRGKTFDVYMPLLPLNPSKHGESPLQRFEFGNEIKYLKEHGAQEEGIVEGGETRVRYTLEQGGFKIIVLATAGAKSRPLEVRAFQEKELVTALHYDEFNASLRFNKALFECPDGIKLTEAD